MALVAVHFLAALLLEVSVIIFIPLTFPSHRSFWKRDVRLRNNYMIPTVENIGRFFLSQQQYQMYSNIKEYVSNIDNFQAFPFGK